MFLMFTTTLIKYTWQRRLIICLFVCFVLWGSNGWDGRFHDHPLEYSVLTIWFVSMDFRLSFFCWCYCYFLPVHCCCLRRLPLYPSTWVISWRVSWTSLSSSSKANFTSSSVSDSFQDQFHLIVNNFWHFSIALVGPGSQLNWVHFHHSRSFIISLLIPFKS